MAHTYDRRLRIADLIKDELAKLLLSQSKDPRFTFVSISAVEVARDYSNAKVFVSLLNDTKIEETLAALNKAAGFFRYELAHSANLRTTPKLHFCYDETIKQGQKISELLKKSSTDSSKE